MIIVWIVQFNFHSFDYRMKNQKWNDQQYISKIISQFFNLETKREKIFFFKANFVCSKVEDLFQNWCRFNVWKDSLCLNDFSIFHKLRLGRCHNVWFHIETRNLHWFGQFCFESQNICDIFEWSNHKTKFFSSSTINII